MKVFLDTESEGLVGPTTTIQTGWEDGPAAIHEVFRSPARDTLVLIERIVDAEVSTFNGVHDWFHIQRLYCILRLLDPGQWPTAAGWLAVQRAAVEGPCLKPRSHLDVMLHAMRGPAQATMERDDIRIKRVPAALAPWLAEHLGQAIQLDALYFERRENGYAWEPDDHQGEQKEFPDVVLRFGAKRSLSALSKHLIGRGKLDYPVPSQFTHNDRGEEWDPFHEGWVPFHDYHVSHWANDPTARQYALDDVDLLRDLWRHFGSPPCGGVDSVLACQVASARWRGYRLDLPMLQEIQAHAETAMEAAPRAPKTVMAGLLERCSPAERLAVEDTSAATLQLIAGTRSRKGWSGGWGEGHAAVPFARSVVAARSAEKERDVCRKLLRVGSFHPSFKVIGTLSGRMAGSGGLNAHGLPGKEKGSRIHDAFPMAYPGEVLGQGDFDAFEVVIMAAVYDDEGLTRELMSGKKIHALFGEDMYELPYDQVRGDEVLYQRSKKALLGCAYGAQDPRVAEVLGLSIEQVQAGTARMDAKFPGIGRSRARTAVRFCSMSQPGGTGTRVVWKDPADFQESLFGFRRYFTLENTICRALYDLAQAPPSGLQIKGTQVQRRAGRLQTPGGATQSALYAAAFSIQAAAMRAAANHEIQATGAEITKNLQVAQWAHQPCGIHPWVTRPMQVHDELQTVHAPGVDLEATTNEVVERYRSRVPLLKMAWVKNAPNWGAK